MKILLIEDKESDALLVQRLLKGYCEVVHATTLKAVAVRLAEGGIDLILSDLGLPECAGIETFKAVYAQARGIPLIVLTGTYQDEALASACVGSGAQDYLVKDGLRADGLKRAIRYALERKKLDAVKENFVGNVTHELRTPLTVLGLGLENLQDGLAGPLTQEQAELIGRNIRNAKHLGKIIDDLLDFSRLQSGQAKLASKKLNLTQLIHKVVENFRNTETASNGLLQEVLPRDLPRLECDPDLIAQVVTNLLSNAVRYAKAKIVVKAERVDGFIQTSVANDGPGIPQEKLTQLFEKFVQLDRRERKGSYKGTGLGLAISKEIIEQHKGKIWVESPGESGVVFYFTLPV